LTPPPARNDPDQSALDAAGDSGAMLRHSLVRDVTAVVALKIVIVVAAAFFVFGPKQRPAIDERAIEMRLTGTTTPDSRSLAP
jgi:hypothetical protein